MPGMIRAPGFVTEAQARDVKAVASQELPDYMEGVTTAEAEREQHRRTEHRICCFHNAPFTECPATALMGAVVELIGGFQPSKRKGGE